MTDLLQAFHFLRPWWLLGLPVSALVIYALSRVQRQGDQWTSIIAPQLLPFLLDAKQVYSTRNLTGWLGIPLTLAILALAGPVWQQIPQPVERNTAAVVICWDLSPSMLAEDVKPSRLERSRLKIIDLLKIRKDGQTALVAYSGEAYVVAPLTEDVETIINLLPSLGPTTLPSVGSNPEMALKEAAKLLRAAGANKGDILFLTDGIDSSAFANLHEQLSKTQDRITLWGMGTKEGGPIPLPQGGFFKDKGNTLVAKINESELRQFASDHQGYYVPAQNTDADITTLNRIFNHKDQQQQATNRQFDQWFEAGQYLVLALLPLTLLLFRRGWLLCLCVLIPLAQPDLAQAQPQAVPPTAPAAAMPPTSPTTAPAPAAKPSALTSVWRDLWQTHDQQGAHLLQKGDAKTAADTFDNPNWRAAAQFKSQDYAAAAQSYKQLGDADNLYNAGNAFTQAGRYGDAIKAYDQALAKNPQLADAANNKKIAEQLKALAAKQKQQQKSDSKDNKDHPKDGQQKSEGDQSQQGSDQSGEQQDSEGKPSDDKSDKSGESQDPATQDQNKPADDKAQNNSKQDGTDPHAQSKDEDSASQNPQTAEQQAQSDAKREAAAKAQAEQDAAKQDKTDGQAEQAGEPAKDDQAAETKTAQAAVDGEKQPQTEEQQKLQQWLNRVPDDPSGLMRNKFKYQYQQRRQQPQTTTDTDNNPEARW